MKKTVSFIILFLISLFFFSLLNCTNMKPEKEEITITLYSFLQYPFQAIVDSEDFKKKFHNVTVHLKTENFAMLHRKLLQKIKVKKEVPDIAVIEIGYISELLDGEYFVDLAREPYKGNEAGKDIAPFAMAQATTAERTLIAMPLFFYPSIMCYRKEFFDAAGIDIENDIKTWADYITLFKNCVYDSDHDKRNDNYLKIDPYDLVTFSLQGDYGGWIEDDMPFQPQEQFLQTLNLVKDFKKLEDETGYSPFFKGHIDYSNLDFYALFFIGPGIFTQMRERLWNEFEGKFRLAHLPGHGQNAYAFNYMFFLGIPLPAEEGRKAVGWKIIKYFTTSPEAQLLLFQTANLYPVLTTVYDDPLMETEVDYFGGQVANELYKKVALNIPSKNISEYDDEASFAFRQAVDSILKGDELSPEDILERARRTVVSKMQGE